MSARLTDIERDQLWQGLRRARHEEAPIPLASEGNRTHVLWALSPAVERIVAARTADAAARLAAVEGVLGACQRYARPMNCGGNATRTWPLSVLACVPCKVRAALSATAPDPGQREAEERAEFSAVVRQSHDAVVARRADRSPED